MKNNRGTNVIDASICLWTVAAVVLHFCEIGKFKDWPVFSLTEWSCMSVFIWTLIFALAVALGIIVYYVVRLYLFVRKEKKSLNEQVKLHEAMPKHDEAYDSRKDKGEDDK